MEGADAEDVGAEPVAEGAVGPAEGVGVAYPEDVQSEGEETAAYRRHGVSPFSSDSCISARILPMAPVGT